MVTTSDDASTLTQVAVHPTCFIDHRLVTSRLHVPRHMPSIKSYHYQCRYMRRVDLRAFQDDVDDYVNLYSSEMQRLLDAMLH